MDPQPPPGPHNRPDPRPRLASLFDALAETYDTTGVEFFTPIAAGLVSLLEPRPGERVADIGCGRGAFLLPAAHAVGPSGRVDGIDLSPGMAAFAATAASAAGLDHVEVAVGDAQAPALPEASYDVLGSSLVLFFLPDPAAALAAWHGLLAEGGRLGVSTFGPYDDVWRAIDELFTPYLPPQMLDARASGRSGPFASDAGMEALVGGAGFGEVRTVSYDLEVRFAGAEQWHAFSWSTGQRAAWESAPEGARADIRAAATELLEQARAEDGACVLRQQIRYTLGVRRG